MLHRLCGRAEHTVKVGVEGARNGQREPKRFAGPNDDRMSQHAASVQGRLAVQQHHVAVHQLPLDRVAHMHLKRFALVVAQQRRVDFLAMPDQTVAFAQQHAAGIARRDGHGRAIGLDHRIASPQRRALRLERILEIDALARGTHDKIGPPALDQLLHLVAVQVRDNDAFGQNGRDFRRDGHSAHGQSRVGANDRARRLVDALAHKMRSNQARFARQPFLDALHGAAIAVTALACTMRMHTRLRYGCA